MDSLRGTAQIFRDTVRFSQVQAQVALLRAHVELDAPVHARCPTRCCRCPAWCARTAFPEWFDKRQAPMYDLAFRSDSVAFRDLQWLYPRFPEEARGSLSLRIEHRPEGMMFLGREIDLRARGTHLVGDFGMILGDTLRFVDVDMEAEPVNTATIERMLPEGLPVQGLRLGGVEIRGTRRRRRPHPRRGGSGGRHRRGGGAGRGRGGGRASPAGDPARAAPAARAGPAKAAGGRAGADAGPEPGSATGAEARARAAEEARRRRQPWAPAPAPSPQNCRGERGRTAGSARGRAPRRALSARPGSHLPQ